MRPLLALSMFEALAAQGCLPAKYYVGMSSPICFFFLDISDELARLLLHLYAYTNWSNVKRALALLCELAIRGYARAHVFLATYAKC